MLALLLVLLVPQCLGQNPADVSVADAEVLVEAAAAALASAQAALAMVRDIPLRALSAACALHMPRCSTAYTVAARRARRGASSASTSRPL